MNKPLIGIDLDGVIAVENRVKYFIAKEEGTSSLLHYYQTLKVDREFINELIKHQFKYRYRVYTARKNDIPNIKQLTYKLLYDNKIIGLLGDIVFTQFRWKGLELYRDLVTAHIDNDYNNLTKLPFIHRIAYKQHGRQMYDKSLFKPHLDTTQPREIFAYLNKVCYNK